jgi:maltose O-acetyltransferase
MQPPCFCDYGTNINCVVLDVCRQEYGEPVDIGADVWVSGAALILAGVRIGSRQPRPGGSARSPRNRSLTTALARDPTAR